MSKLMIIGCGGVASVAIHKVCQNDGVFDELMIASRTVSKCDALKEKLEGQTKTKITTAQIDADDVEVLVVHVADLLESAVARGRRDRAVAGRIESEHAERRSLAFLGSDVPVPLRGKRGLRHRHDAARRLERRTEASGDADGQ